MLLLVFTICLSACHKTYYFQVDGVYCSVDPFIELNCVDNSGTLVIDDVSYELDLAFDPQGRDILIFYAGDENQPQWETIRDDDRYGDKLIWQADTEEKNGKLYLTVTKDNISNYEGKTIVLEFEPNAE